jgi:hypothetical protein
MKIYVFLNNKISSKDHACVRHSLKDPKHAMPTDTTISQIPIVLSYFFKHSLQIDCDGLYGFSS